MLSSENSHPRERIQESDWRIFFHELTRRELLQDTAVFAAFMLMARFGGEKILRSPIGIFLLTQPYVSPTVRRNIHLSEKQIQSGKLFSIGGSYPHGQGGISPSVLMAQEITNAGIGEWKAVDKARSGSYVDDMLRQGEELKEVSRDTSTELVVTDSGYNSVTEGIIRDPGALQDLLYIMQHIQDGVSIGDLPGVIRRLSTVCEVFLIALQETRDQLIKVIPQLLKGLGIDEAYFYKFPPLQRAKSLVHIPQPGDLNQTRFELPIRGNAIRELFAKHVEIHGSNMGEGVAECLSPEGFFLIPIDLSRILTGEDYGDTIDEHPGESGWVKISNEQTRLALVNGRSLNSILNSIR